MASATESRTRNCRHCTNMVCGDANYCEYTGETYSDGYIRAHRNCPGFDYNQIDALTLEDPQHDRSIADELNATLGDGECRITASSTDGLTSDEPKQWFELSCGHAFKLYGLDAPVACPVCGKAVKR